MAMPHANYNININFRLLFSFLDFRDNETLVRQSGKAVSPFPFPFRAVPESYPPLFEENFRIMKSEFEARPVCVRREDRIRAHFLTCYISLLVYRLLEKKLGNAYTCSQLLQTLSRMNVTKLSTINGYVPSYKRIQLTDDLHELAGFRTDYEFITKATMRVPCV